MIDFRTARIQSHRRNIQRYARLLSTELTDLERQYLRKRIVEEQIELERLEKDGQLTLPISNGAPPSANDAPS